MSIGKLTRSALLIGLAVAAIFAQNPVTRLSGTTSSIGGAALLAGECSSGTVTVTGANVGMGVVATPTTFPGTGSTWYGYVSSANTVTVSVCAIVGLTTTTSTYNVRVLP